MRRVNELSGSRLLFSDEQSVFAEVVAYALPNGSSAFTNSLADAPRRGPRGGTEEPCPTQARLA